MRFLCCDLGGSFADWGVFDTEEEIFVFRTELRTSEHVDFYDMMDHFLVEYRDRFSGDEDIIVNATFGVAGPTDHKKVRPTNIEGWEINAITANAILEEHGHTASASIVNDFEALGYGVLYKLDKGFAEDDYEDVYGRFRQGPVRIGEDVRTRSLVCGPGTGLGLACLVDGLMRNGYPFIISSEGGHASLAPETVGQFRQLGNDGTFAGKKSYEEVLSHVGLRNLYNFFRRVEHAAEPNYSLTSEEIFMLAENGDQAAIDATELFCENLATFCGNAALYFNTDKAVFLWGGALKKVSPDLLLTRFKRHYAARVNYSDRVARVPVVLLRNRDIPLLGCAYRSKFEVEFERVNQD